MTRRTLPLMFGIVRLFSLGTAAFDLPDWCIAQLPLKEGVAHACRKPTEEGVSSRNTSRRSMIFGSAAAATLFSLSAPALADTEKAAVVTDVTIKNFSVSLPSNWKIITKPPLNNSEQQKWNRGKKGPTLFSAIDFQSGSVISVVQEEACNVKEYAQSTQICDLVLPSGDDKTLFSEDTLSKDVSKLLVRHDDRDNAVLQGTSKVDSYQLLNNSSRKNIVDLLATTSLPSGGTYRDTMGIDRPSMIDRKVKARSVLVTTAAEEDGEKEGTSTTSILSLWLSAPLDEWQKPAMGTKLNQIWDSVKYE